jgi:hypothetical protein
MYSKDSKEPKRELKREPKPPSLADFVPQLLHQNNCKIDPCRTEFAMMISRPYSFGNVVAQGLNLCIPLKARIVSLLLPVMKIVSQLTKTHNFDDNIVL